MEDSTQQRQFEKDLIDAGYKKYGSEDENQILRKGENYNKLKDWIIKNNNSRNKNFVSWSKFSYKIFF